MIQAVIIFRWYAVAFITIQPEPTGITYIVPAGAWFGLNRDGSRRIAQRMAGLMNKTICMMIMACVHGANGTPRIVEVAYPTDNVPIVSYVVTEAPYNADKTGETDCTEAFRDALADAGKRGGTVFAPAGRYRFEGTLEFPSGVTLRGEWKKPTEENKSVLGTILMVYGGHGTTDGAPFIRLNGGMIQDLNIYYPKQSPAKVVPYPMTVDADGAGVIKNVTMVNPYRGAMSRSLTTIFNLYMCPLRTGITAIHAAAVPRCSGIMVSPCYWSESGLDDAPDRAMIREALAEQDAFGFQINRQDGGMFVDVLIEDYPTGIKFMPPHGWTYWYNLRTRNVDVALHYTGGSHQRASFTRCSLSARKHAILMRMDKRGWDSDGWARLSKSRQPFGVAGDRGGSNLLECTIEAGASAVCLDGSFEQAVNLQNCTFAAWGGGADDFAITSKNGGVTVFDSRFAGEARHVKVEPGGATLVGNTFGGEPDIRVNGDEATIDHTPLANPPQWSSVVVPVPDTLPAKADADSLFVVEAPGYEEGDATAQIQAALKEADAYGGGTVYLPQGTYKVTRHLHVPAGVELRGVNDMMPRQYQVRTMLAPVLPDDVGKPDNPPFITLGSDPGRGGSGVTGLGIIYPDQDYKSPAFKPYPWTIRSLGPGCWVRRVNMGNLYNGIDFGTHNSDRHVIRRVTGSALNTAFRVGKTPTIGWIDCCQIRPQDWSCSSARDLPIPHPGKHPVRGEVGRGQPYTLVPNLRGAAAVVIDSGANEQIHGVWANGPTRMVDFVDSDGTSGGHARFIVGGSEAGTGAWIHDLGSKGVDFVGFSFNPQSRLPYVRPEQIPPHQLPKGMVMRVDEDVTEPINFIGGHFCSRTEVKLSFDIRAGRLTMVQTHCETSQKAALTLDLTGGTLTLRNSPHLGKIRRRPHSEPNPH